MHPNQIPGAHPLVAQHGEAEVAELEAPGTVGVHVGGLDVQVEDPGAVQRRQAARHVAQHLRHRRLPQAPIRRRLRGRTPKFAGIDTRGIK